MRFLVVIFFFAVPVLFGQVCHLHDYPEQWSGDSSLFEKSGQGIRSAGNAVTETIGIFREIHHGPNAQLEVSVKLDFALSTSNYLRWIIAADSSSVNYSKALIVKWNGSAKNFLLQSINGAVVTTLITGISNRLSASGKVTQVKLILVGSSATLYSDTSGAGVWEKEGEAVVPDIQGKWTGFVFTHTSTRADKLELLSYCTAPPVLRIAEWEMISADSLLLSLSAKADTTSIPAITPVQLKTFLWENDSSLLVVLGEKLRSDHSVKVFVTGVRSVGGTSMVADSIEIKWIRNVLYHDIRISEILVDPSEHGPGEFVELYNTSGDTLYLKGWRICDASSCGTLPDIAIAPDHFLVLSTQLPFVQVPAFPSLNNGSDSLRLYNAQGFLVDNIYYTTSWWKGKTQDGNSIELLDLYSRCAGSEVWTPCFSGNTAGFKNSVSLDSLKYAVVAIQEHNHSVRVKFSIPMQNGNASLRINGFLYNGIFSENEWTGFFDLAASDGTITVEYPLLNSCRSDTGLTLSVETNVLRRPQRRDVIVNELLFNPIAYGHDYVELKNVSGHFLYVDTIRISNTKDTVSYAFNSVLKKDELIVWTEDTSWVNDHYHTCSVRWIEEDLPAFPDTAGVVQIWSLEELDLISYHEDWHHSLIEEREGTALERIQVGGPDQYQWISCAAGGRPGCSSPDYREDDQNDFYCSADILSPDADGRDDVLMFSWKGSEPLVRASLYIYSLAGIRVKELLRDRLWEKDQLVWWDGSGEDGMLPPDWYIVELICENEKEVKKTRRLVALLYP